MTQEQTQLRRVVKTLQLDSTQQLSLKLFGLTHVTDLIIRESKYFIMIYSSGQLELYRSWTGERYGDITLDNAKRLINTNNKR
jgi:hypothetical protein